MALPARLLGDDEAVIDHLRTHWKALVLPVLLLLALVFGAAVATTVMPRDWQPWAGWALWVLVAVIAVVGTLVPVLRWATTTYTITNRRVITRRGIITRTGHDVPIGRINDVTYTRDLLDRLLGCGTLVFTTAAEAPLSLHDVPDVEAVHLRVTQVLFSGGPSQPPAHP